MAQIRQKEIVKVGGQTWEFSDTNPQSGRTTNYTELAVQVKGNNGTEDMVLRTASKKLLEAIKPGVVVHGYIFKSDDAQYPDSWRIRADGKNNPHLTDPDGKYSHAPAPTQGAQAPQQGQQATPVAARTYTVEEIAALYEEAIGVSQDALEELTDEARVLSVNALFSSFVENGCKVGQTQSAPPSSMNKPMQVQLIDTIKAVLNAKGLSDLYAASSIADEALITAWQAAGGNDNAFVIAAKILLTESDDTPPPAMDATDDDEGLNGLPF